MGKNIPMYFGYMSLWDIANAGIKRLGEKIIEKRKTNDQKNIDIGKLAKNSWI